MTEQTTEAIIFYEDNYLFQKRLTSNSVVFEIFDTSRSIFPEGDYRPTQDTSRFKFLGSYQFSLTDEENFKRFLQSLSRKGIIPRGYADNPVNETLKNFLTLEKNKIEKGHQNIKNPYDYEFLKLHVSLNAKISSRKQEEFLNNHLKDDPKTIGNKVYMGDWIHLFTGLHSTSMLDGLKINEVELDTSVILNKDNRDEEVESTWRNIQAGLMFTRH